MLAEGVKRLKDARTRVGIEATPHAFTADADP